LKTLYFIIKNLVVVVVLLNPFREMGAWRNSTDGPRPKVWTRGQKWK